MVAVGDMLPGFRVTVPFRQAKIYHVAHGAFITRAHHEIVWLDVPVQEVLLLHELNAGYHLLAEHANRFKRKFAVTVLEEFFQRGAK